MDRGYVRFLANVALQCRLVEKSRGEEVFSRVNRRHLDRNSEANVREMFPQNGVDTERAFGCQRPFRVYRFRGLVT
jgi:hypothetical protein